jgi:hypothetical protein
MLYKISNDSADLSNNLFTINALATAMHRRWLKVDAPGFYSSSSGAFKGVAI